jgi:hypothetical protein
MCTARSKEIEGMSAHRKTDSRIATESTIAGMISKGDELELGEPVGVVLLYPGETFIKAVWKKDANREETSTALLNASLDEMGKINEP